MRSPSIRGAPSHEVAAALDPHRVGQIVANLAENALKFAAETVSIRPSEDEPGFDPHLRRRRQPRDRRRGSARTCSRNAAISSVPLCSAARSASGIGLAIVSELTEAMSGEIEVVSPVENDGGTSITIVAPRDHAWT